MWAALALGVVLPGQVLAAFPDVQATGRYGRPLAFLQEQGIFSGYNDGTFKPDKTINRAEALKVLLLARQKLQIPDQEVAPINRGITFPDVKSTDWFFDGVNQAVELGIAKGYDDGKFRPAGEITMAESLKIIEIGLTENFKQPGLNPTDKVPFTDVPVGRWYLPFAVFAKNAWLVEAREDGSLGPDRKMTRAEFAELLYRMMQLRLNKTESYKLGADWNYCREAGAPYQMQRPWGWTSILAGDQLILWHRDGTNRQLSFSRVYPNSAVAIIAVDKNTSALSLEKYLELIDYGTEAIKNTGTINGLPHASVELAKTGLQDHYLRLPDGKILVLYTQTGDGPLQTQLRAQLQAIVAGVKTTDAQADLPSCLDAEDRAAATPAPSAQEKLTDNVLRLVLQKGQADEALAMLDDELLIETDTMGIGTGPVDYYFSARLNSTLKIERNTFTILATKSGKTSAF